MFFFILKWFRTSRFCVVSMFLFYLFIETVCNTIFIIWRVFLWCDLSKLYIYLFFVCFFDVLSICQVLFWIWIDSVSMLVLILFSGFKRTVVKFKMYCCVLFVKFFRHLYLCVFYLDLSKWLVGVCIRVLLTLACVYNEYLFIPMLCSILNINIVWSSPVWGSYR